MKTIFFSLFFIGAYVYSPAGVLGQESLLTRSIKGNSRIIYSIAFSPDGKYIASGGVDKTLKVWSAEDGSAFKTFSGHKNFLNSVAFSADGKNLASGSEDGTVKIWNLEDGTCLNTFKGHKDSVWSAVFFPGGERVASAGTDGTIRLWQLASRKPYRTIRGHSAYIYAVSVSPDGKVLASGSADRTIKVWDAETGARKITLEGHTGAVNSLSFSKTGDYLASGSDDGTVKIWRIKDGLCIKTITASQQPVLTVSYSPDDAYIFSGGSDLLVNAWNVSGALARTFKGHNGSVKSLALSPDGKYLASGSFDKTIKLWLTPWEAEAREREIKKEAEINKNYSLHYEAALKFESSPIFFTRFKAIEEFKKALSYKQEKDCEEKLAAAVKEKERLIKTGWQSLLGVFAVLVAGGVVFRLKKNKGLRVTLPGRIKSETMSGSYEKAFKMYADYKSIGGDMARLPQEEMLELYRGMQALEDLAKENLPYPFLLSYAVKFVKEGNMSMAQSMLRSGRLLDQFKNPGEYDVFVGLYEEARRPENLLMVKFKPGTYSSLAEAFFKVRNYDYCEKMCGLKKQFHTKEISPRDNELFAACQKGRAQADAEKPA